MKTTVLDHGYVEFIEAWGHGKSGVRLNQREISVTENVTEIERWDDNEVGIIEAARQSTQGSFRGWEPKPCDCDWNPLEAGEDHDPDCAFKKNPGDAKLLKSLSSRHHDTPFEFSGMVIEVQAPIFVFREWHRHRTMSYNEASARYAPLPELYYTPDTENAAERTWYAGITKNRQAGSLTNPKMTEVRPTVDVWLKLVEETYQQCEMAYQLALSNGIPKELARLVMPVGHYSRMRVAANLHNWFRFLNLRTHPDAQWEIQQYAFTVAEIIKATFPQSFDLWEHKDRVAAWADRPEKNPDL